MVKEIKSAKLADQVRDYLALWIAKDYPGLFISVSDATLTPDLREVVIWVSVMSVEIGPQVVRKLSKRVGRYQRLLNKKIQRHTVPKIIFRLDNQMEIENRFNSLLNQ